MNTFHTPASVVRRAIWVLLLVISSPLAAQVTHEVTVGDNFFSPSSLTIQVGDTVRWVNAAGGNNHNVTDNGGSFASQTSSSFTFSQTFNSAGTVNYRCTIHAGSMQGTITVQGVAPQPADLSLLSVDATPGTYAPGDNISIGISIQNVGGETSPAASITYYASTNSTINGSDTELGTDALGALAAGATNNYTASGTFPNNIPDGTYFIGAIIDLNDANTGNNTDADNGTITIQADVPDPVVDLAVQTVNAPSGTFEQGEDLSIGVSIRNFGDMGSDSYTVNLYASTNTQVNAADTFIGSANRGALAGGAQDTFNVQVNLPEMLTPDNYFIGAIIDIDDENNANNTGVDNVAITVVPSGGGDDFLINEGLNDAWFNPLTPGQGFFITVFPDIQMMFVAWFTFETQRPPANVEAILGEPGHRWLTAFGPYSGDSALLDVELTQGGTFDSATPAVTQGPDGTLEVDFTGCNEGMIHYELTAANISGDIPIERIAVDNVPFCEAQAVAR
ncbi:MAG TPA: CARDB domain-containing protein [Xanthomonadales bacterium]|nr:CARDB domain-containing protein [Xanthomonadales bacterium]